MSSPPYVASRGDSGGTPPPPLTALLPRHLPSPPPEHCVGSPCLCKEGGGRAPLLVPLPLSRSLHSRSASAMVPAGSQMVRTRASGTRSGLPGAASTCAHGASATGSGYPLAPAGGDRRDLCWWRRGSRWGVPCASGGRAPSPYPMGSRW